MGVKNYIGTLTVNNSQVVTAQQLRDIQLLVSEGLSYTSATYFDVQEFYVKGRGTCSDVDIVIPSRVNDNKRVVSILANAFQNETDIVSVIIPKTINGINERAFENCSGLISIFIPNSVQYMQAEVFKGCSKLTIYCEAKSKPDDWDETWSGECPVIWGAIMDFEDVNNSISEITTQIGDIDSALDTIIAIQESLIGGNT